MFFNDLIKRFITPFQRPDQTPFGILPLPSLTLPNSLVSCQNSSRHPFLTPGLLPTALCPGLSTPCRIHQSKSQISTKSPSWRSTSLPNLPKPPSRFPANLFLLHAPPLVTLPTEIHHALTLPGKPDFQALPTIHDFLVSHWSSRTPTNAPTIGIQSAWCNTTDAGIDGSGYATRGSC